MTALLRITDGTDANSVELLAAGEGLLLRAWTPMIMTPKGGGTWSNNPFSEGKQPVAFQDDDVTDSLDLYVHGRTQAAALDLLRKLRMLLRSAQDYWVSSRTLPPVYIEKRADGETYSDYAVIKDWRTPHDGDLFNPPFIPHSTIGGVTMEDFTLLITHGAWLAQRPGLAACIPLDSRSIMQEYNLISASPNLVTNGDFTTAGGGGADVFANWTEVNGGGGASIVRDLVWYQSAPASCKLTQGAGSTYVEQAVATVIKGQQYAITFAYRSDVAGGARVLVRDTLNAVDIIDVTFPQFITGNVTKTVYFTAAANATAGTVLVRFYAVGAAGLVVNYDDVVVNFAAVVSNVPEQQCARSVLNNGGFEGFKGVNDFSNWFESPVAGQVVTRDTADKHSGAASCKVTCNGAGAAGLLENTAFTVIPGEYYFAEVWAKNTCASQHDFFVKDPSNNVIALQYITPSAASWKKYTVIFQAPTAITTMFLTVDVSNTAAGTLWVDDVAVVPLSLYSQKFPNLNAPAFVANYTAANLITHIFLDEAGVFTANLLGSTPPYNLFRAGNVAYITYFGCSTVFPNTHSVWALALDLIGATEMKLVGAWQYWSGAAWVAFVQAPGNGGAFATAAPNLLRDGPIVIDLPPENTQAATAVNGVTAFWIRFVPASWATTGYITANAQPYYPNKTFTKIAAASVSSELPPLAELHIDALTTASGNPASLAIALRSVSRGARFNPIIPFTRNGKEAEITLGVAGSLSYQAGYFVPSFEYVRFDGAVPSNLTLTMTTPLINQYFGRFHVYMRVRQNNGAAGDMNAFMIVGTLSYVYANVKTATFNTPELLDMGIVTIPGFDISANDPLSSLQFIFTLQRTTGASTLDIYDLVLIPVDEFAAELRSDSAATPFIFPSRNPVLSSMEPRRVLRSLVDVETSTGSRQASGALQAVSPGPLMLHAEEEQFLIVYPLHAIANTVCKLSLFGSMRFYDARGSI